MLSSDYASSSKFCASLYVSQYATDAPLEIILVFLALYTLIAIELELAGGVNWFKVLRVGVEKCSFFIIFKAETRNIGLSNIETGGSTGIIPCDYKDCYAIVCW